MNFSLSIWHCPEGALAASNENACSWRKSPLGDLGVKEKLMRHYFILITYNMKSISFQNVLIKKRGSPF